MDGFFKFLSRSMQPNSYIFMSLVATAFYFVIYFSLCILYKVFEIPKNTGIYYWAMFICIYNAIGVLYARHTYSTMSRFLYKTTVQFWGYLIYYFLFSALYFIINYFITVSRIYGICLIFMPSISIFLYGVINACFINIERIRLILPHKLSKPVKLIHISDIHLGPIYGKSYIQKIVNEIQKLKPDLVIFTGDLYDGSTPVIKNMLEPFNQLEMKIYMVMGNHDILVAGEENVKNALKDTKIRLLSDENIIDFGINFIGINYSTDWNYLNKQLTQNKYLIKEDMPNILLYHVPVNVEIIEKYNIDLQLSGHTHGGQVFPFNIETAIIFAYAKGLHKSKSGKSYVFVSQGTGTAGPAMRFMSNTVITEFELI